MGNFTDEMTYIGLVTKYEAMGHLIKWIKSGVNSSVNTGLNT